MESKEKLTDLVFKYHYDSLPEEERADIRNKFLQVSGVAYTTFYHKLRKDKFTPLEKVALDQICSCQFSWSR